jgi:hypothetical protein
MFHGSATEHESARSAPDAELWANADAPASKAPENGD